MQAQQAVAFLGWIMIYEYIIVAVYIYVRGIGDNLSGLPEDAALADDSGSGGFGKK